MKKILLLLAAVALSVGVMSAQEPVKKAVKAEDPSLAMPEVAPENPVYDVVVDVPYVTPAPTEAEMKAKMAEPVKKVVKKETSTSAKPVAIQPLPKDHPNGPEVQSTNVQKQKVAVAEDNQVKKETPEK